MKQPNIKSTLRRLFASILIVLFISIAIILFIFRNDINFSGISTQLTTLINILFSLTILSIIFVILFENKSPEKTTAWLLVLVFLPVIGLILYLFLGRNLRKQKMFTNKKLYNDLVTEDSEDYSDKYQSIPDNIFNKNRLVSLLRNNSKSELTFDNEINIYSDAANAFQKMLDCMEQAKKFIHLEYFSVSNDLTGNQLLRVLQRKAKEGIEIKFIMDGVGCFFLSQKYVRALKNYGVETAIFQKVFIPFINSKLNYRNHRKLTIIDGKIAFIGGFNIGDKYMSKSKYYGYWRDTQVQISGNAVTSIHKIFLSDWVFIKGDNLTTKKYLQNKLEEPLTIHQSTDCRGTIQISASGPDSNWASIMQAFFFSIANAKRKIFITTPYLVLNESLVSALITSALCGVEIKIIVPGIPDHLIVYWGTRSYFEQLLESGIRIFEYKKGFIHAKQMLVDSEIASVGTSNMDMRSFLQNFEVNIFLYDQSVIRILEKQFYLDLSVSEEINLELFRERNILKKSLESVSRLFSPLL
ncbi:MAG: cardiolipin synthase [Candidatus Cloacimonetes bacterium]|nr:cardiolipin synthase [Candidatus Cloacimonadota bacterium]